ncbi:transcription elongation factor [Haloferula sargassicola]|uniref:Transcription elongation factor GreAB n=1 Tax=Haloferula sargassicola TaxID=490096 RepID=A0ABP9UU54_9BACT
MTPKKELVARILEELRRQLAKMEHAAREAHAAASDPGSKAESKYDTRSLEASYLAAGQAQQVADLAAAVTLLASFEARDFDLDDEIDAGALVAVSGDEEGAWYLLAPAAGGLAIPDDGLEITVLTPASRLYQNLIGKTLGDEVEEGFVTELR